MQKTCNTSNGPSTERQRALRAIDEELSTFSIEEARIQQARYTLIDTRNVSRMVAPIYSLPSEILARIFSDAACCCTNETFHEHTPHIANPVMLSGVCKRWRQVAVNHQPLWTHIDLVVAGDNTNRGYHPPEIWEERSQGALLYLNIYQYRLLNYIDVEEDYDNTYADELDSAPMFNKLLNFLSPLMSQVCSMTLVLDFPTEPVLAKLLGSWLLNYTSGQPQALRLQAHHQSPKLYLTHRESTFGLAASTRVLRYKGLFESLRILHLCNIIPSWTNLSLENLTDLRLESGETWSITQNELASLLMSCPRLQCLALDRLSPGASNDSSQIVVTLNELRMIYIRDPAWSHLVEFVLDIINPGSNPLTMTIFLPFAAELSSRALAAVQTFAGRSNVKTLHIKSGRGHMSFASQLWPLPHVETLTLQKCHFSDAARVGSFVLDRDTSPRPTRPESALCPSLRSLYLKRCTVDQDYAHQLLSHHHIQAIYLRECCVSKETPCTPKPDGPQVSEECWQFLSELVPKIVHVKDEWGPWPL
ncbi:hypothetical protein FRC12_016517, partial [Ceratobasidium sp. 428]